MCGNRSFRPAESGIPENKKQSERPQNNNSNNILCENPRSSIKKCPDFMNYGCITDSGKKIYSTNKTTSYPNERPHTAEELRKMKQELDELRAYKAWSEKCNAAAEEQYAEELKQVLAAQDKIRKDLDHKRAQKLAAAAMEDEAWVFEKSANGWI